MLKRCCNGVPFRGSNGPNGDARSAVSVLLDRLFGLRCLVKNMSITYYCYILIETKTCYILAFNVR